MARLYKLSNQDAVVYREKSDLIEALRSLYKVGNLEDFEVEVYEDAVEGEPDETLHPNTVLRQASAMDEWLD